MENLIECSECSHFNNLSWFSKCKITKKPSSTQVSFDRGKSINFPRSNDSVVSLASGHKPPRRRHNIRKWSGNILKIYWTILKQSREMYESFGRNCKKIKLKTNSCVWYKQVKRNNIEIIKFYFYLQLKH